MQAHRQIGLRQADVLLCQQKQKAQLIAYILTMDILSADSDIEADWKAGKVLCAVFITQIDDLIEFQPQAFNDIQRSLRIQTSKLPVLAIIRIQYFIQTSGREVEALLSICRTTNRIHMDCTAS